MVRVIVLAGPAERDARQAALPKERFRLRRASVRHFTARTAPRAVQGACERWRYDDAHDAVGLPDLAVQDFRGDPRFHYPRSARKHAAAVRRHRRILALLASEIGRLRIFGAVGERGCSLCSNRPACWPLGRVILESDCVGGVLDPSRGAINEKLYHLARCNAHDLLQQPRGYTLSLDVIKLADLTPSS
jgi:hypothetical protein